jgi:hypothetical protein
MTTAQGGCLNMQAIYLPGNELIARLYQFLRNTVLGTPSS